MNLFVVMRSWWGGWFVRLAMLGCYALSAIYFLIVLLMAWKGGVWAYIIYAENPYAHVLGGILFLFAAHVLRIGHRMDALHVKRLLAKSALLVVGIGLAWITGEIGLRYILMMQQQQGSVEKLRSMRAKGKEPPIRSDHPLAVIIEFSESVALVYELRPNLDMLFGRRVLRTNSRGMRADRDFDEQKPANTIRILGLGDSGMFGWNVDQGEEYMAVLEKILNQRDDGIAYEVLNIAVPGYNTALEMESYAHKGRVFGPDIVIIGWCVNDYQLPFFMLEVENFRRRDVSFLHLYLFRRDQIAEVVAGRKMRSMRDVNKANVAEEITNAAGMDGVKRALIRMKEFSEQDGFHLLLAGPLKEDIQEIARDVGIATMNTYEKLKPGDYPREWEVHFMHPKPPGHALIAEALANDLDARGWLKLP